MTEGPRRPRRRGPVAVEEERTVRRAAAAASVGNIAEWYDFGLFSFLSAVVLNRVFYPEAGEWSLTLTLATFAAAFVVRPLGGFVFGPLGDRIGRTRVLAFTVLLMTVATLALGLVPSYETAGVAAPLLVLLIRMLQGFSAGGEYTGALTLVAEYAPDRRRGFFGSWLEFGTITGYMLGAGSAAHSSRYCPSRTCSTGAGGSRSCSPSPRHSRHLPADAPGGHPGVPAADGTLPRARDDALPAGDADPGPPLPGAGPGDRGAGRRLERHQLRPDQLHAHLPDRDAPRHGQHGASGAATGAMLVAVMLLMLCVITEVGRLSDRIGRKPVLMVTSLTLVAVGLPAVWLMRDGMVGQFVGLLLMAVILVGFAAVLPSTLPAQFPTMVRYGGLGVVFNLSVSLFAGTAPTLIETAVTATGNLDWPGYFLVAAGLVGVVAVVFLPESAGRPLAGAAPLTSSADLPRRRCRPTASRSSSRTITRTDPAAAPARPTRGPSWHD